MCEELLINHCSPTLAGIKTGSLVNVKASCIEELLAQLREMNIFFRPKGLKAIPLSLKDDQMMLYLYRPEMLKHDLSAAAARELLSARGYEPESVEGCLAYLIRRIKQKKDFPHEIGLFLGYPPEDVKGFILNGGKNCKYLGIWKVYGELDSALEYFAKCRQCSEIYRKRWRTGCSMEQLTVKS